MPAAAVLVVLGAAVFFRWRGADGAGESLDSAAPEAESHVPGRAAERPRVEKIGAVVKEAGAATEPAGTAKKWWADAIEFRAQHVRAVTTQNFNSTLQETAEVEMPLLIAFYDPRSVSFKDLRPHLAQAGEALAVRGVDGRPLGLLGTCDVTLHTFLSKSEAHQLTSGWQEIQKTSFRFGRARYYPLIINVYLEGKRRGEYTGVVAKEPIAEFVWRLRAPRGGAKLVDEAATADFLTRPGPFAFGCGLPPGSNESSAFNESAYTLHGSGTFGLLSVETCTAVFGLSDATFPLVAWTRGGAPIHELRSGGGALRLESNRTVLSDTSLLKRWLVSKRRAVFEEMTPDNSHVYLDSLTLLVIYLVGSKDTASRKEGEALFGALESALEEESGHQGNRTIQYQFVWSDCKVYGRQFDAKGECPVFVLVNIVDMSWKKLPLTDLHLKATADKASLDGTLLQWLHTTSEPWRSEIEKLKEAMALSTAAPGGAEVEGATKAEESQEEPAAAAEAHDEDEAKPSSDMSWYDKVVPEGDDGNFSSPKLYYLYHGLLHAVADLKVSFEAKYNQTVQFDWSTFYKVQDMAPNMRILAASPSELELQIRQHGTGALWKAVEHRAAFEFELTDWTDSVSNETNKTRITLGKKFYKGYVHLRKLFVRLFKTLHDKARSSTLQPVGRTRSVDRRSASDLTVQEFIDQYARLGNPVIITGLNLSPKEPWTLDFFKRICNTTVQLKEKNETIMTWGRLQDAGDLPLAEFIETFLTNDTRKKWYLHDWSLPTACPKVFGPAPYEGWTVPKYFAGDYFQRAAFNGYQHSWPSLFIGSEQTESALHVDSGGTNFWLQLLSGKKEWRFYSRRDLINLYWKPFTAHYYVDAFRPMEEFFPLLKHADLYVGIQEEGDLMFIPGGNPHAVRNLEPIHGISMNYVDASNVWTYLYTQLQEGSWEAVEMFTDHATIPHGLSSDQEDLSFGDWKSTRWTDLKYDIS